jgi:DNA helicase-2/ATP-dependent DNA helicase PcrA
MSVSHVSAFLKCPTAFYFRYLLRAPSPMSLPRVFGLAVHAGLEFAFKWMMKQIPREFPPVELFMETFKAYMDRHEADFTPAAFRRRMEYAEVALPAFYLGHVDEWSKDSLAEYAIRNVTVDGVPITGNLDRIEFLPGSEGKAMKKVNVIDDKSGDYAYAVKKLQGPNPEKVAKALADGKVPNAEDLVGGDYYRQAIFYNILAEADLDRGWKVNEVAFEFVDPDKKTGEYHRDVIVASEDDVNFVKKQIAEVYEKIMNHEFSEGCNDPDCEWCNFVKQHYKGLADQGAGVAVTAVVAELDMAA